MCSLFPSVFRRVSVAHNFQQYRHFPRWASRRPMKVFQPEEYDAKNDSVKTDRKAILHEHDNIQRNLENKPGLARHEHYAQLDQKIKWRQPRDKIRNTKPNESLKKKSLTKPLAIVNKQSKVPIVTTDMLETVINEEGKFVYTKMADNDPRISRILVDIKSKKEKDKNDLIVLEGKRLIKDALSTNCKLEYILFSRKKDVEDIQPLLPKLGAHLYKMPYSEIQMWSELTTSPGIMGVFKIPNTESYVPRNSIPLIVICDNVREPSNLGAILRTCSGVGCEKVLLTKGCVNVWDSKVIRSAAGTHFRLQIHRKLDWDQIRRILPENANVYIADNTVMTSTNENTELEPDEIGLSEIISSIPLVPYFGVCFSGSSQNVLIIGGETEGISEDSYRLAYEFSGARLNVPLSNNVDSLNTGTALGVISFEIKRQLILNGELGKQNVRNSNS